MPTEKTKAETQAKRVMARFMREAMANLPTRGKKKVLAFVTLNREVLIQYWKFEIGTLELGRLLQKV